MRLENPLDNLSQALASAQYVNLPEVTDERRKIGSLPFKGNRQTPAEYQAWKKSAYEEFQRRPFSHEIFVVAMFPQMWGSTALGFGGAGGQAMTDAYTIIVGSSYSYIYCVYFGGIFAYSLDMTKCDIKKLNEDIANKNVAEVRDKDRYLK